MIAAAKQEPPSAGGPGAGWSDERLVAACQRGDERAWNALVDKYSRYVYAIILRYGVASADAPDLFQTVWVTVYGDLQKLRETGSLKAWLATVTRRRCYHWGVEQRRRERGRVWDEAGEIEPTVDPIDLSDIDQDQRVRESVLRLPERCRELVRLLFFADPPRPYREIAGELGLAVGSIGFIRGRCLRKLQRLLESAGVV